MKEKTYKVLAYALCLFILSLQACKEENSSRELLEQAEQKAENEPKEALSLLNSIHDPAAMDKDRYMRYVLTQVQAKAKTGQNIKNDTLIFEVQRYFDSKNNPALSALANFYTASVYYEKDMPYKDLEHSKLALFYAKEAKNDLLTAKSLNIIGNTYNDKDILDSAIVYYKQALIYYAKKENNEKHSLEVIKDLGMAYRKMKKWDNAYNYFNDGYKLSLSSNNLQYQITFKHMLGTIYNDMKEYDKAEEHLQYALSKTLNPEEKRRIYLSLLLLYNNTNQLDSAGHYVALLKKSLPEITYPYTLQESYVGITEYYQKIGDYKEVAKYSGLEKDIELQIYESNNSKLLLEVDQKYKDALQKKEIQSAELRNNLLWLCGILAFLFISAMIYIRIKHIRQKEAEQRKLLQAELKAKEAEIKARKRIGEQQAKSIEYLKSIYGNIIRDWGEIDKKVRVLAKELGTTEEPELYAEIKNVIESFKQNTNKHLIQLAKDYLRDKSYGKDALSVLNDKDLLLFMLYYKEYSRNEVSILLGVNPHKQNMMLRKLELKNKLVRVGMPRERISQILFKEDNLDYQTVALF